MMKRLSLHILMLLIATAAHAQPSVDAGAANADLPATPGAPAPSKAVAQDSQAVVQEADSLQKEMDNTKPVFDDAQSAPAPVTPAERKKQQKVVDSTTDFVSRALDKKKKLSDEALFAVVKVIVRNGQYDQQNQLGEVNLDKLSRYRVRIDRLLSHMEDKGIPSRAGKTFDPQWNNVARFNLGIPRERGVNSTTSPSQGKPNAPKSAPGKPGVAPKTTPRAPTPPSKASGLPASETRSEGGVSRCTLGFCDNRMQSLSSVTRATFQQAESRQDVNQTDFSDYAPADSAPAKRRSPRR